MPVQVSYPGVYIQETPSGVQTIAGVSTSVTSFVGMSSKGPLMTPTRVLGFTEFERIFGSDVRSGELADQVRQFFQNGGQQAFVSRIAHDAHPAQVILADETGNQVLALEAESAGAIGQTLRLSIDYDTDQPEATFKLTVNPEGADREVHDGLSMDPASSRYVVDVLERESNLIRPSQPQPANVPVNGFSMAGTLQSSGVIDNLLTILDSNPGSFQISVDGSQPLTVDVDPTAVGELATNFEAPINLALVDLGLRVTVSLQNIGDFSGLRIESDQAGGSVRISPALQNDIAVAMQMGAAQGGLEVHGFGTLRPAPTGLFSVVGPPASLDALSNFVALDPDDVTELIMTDATGPRPPLPLTWVAVAGQDMSVGSSVGAQANSLLNVAENLRALASSITASGDVDWTAAVHGLRVVLTPNFVGGPDQDVTASLATGNENIGTGEADQLFEAAANVRQVRLGGFGNIGSYVEGTQQGSNGAKPELPDYEKAWRRIDKEVDIVNLLALPKAAGQTDHDRSLLWGSASTFCQERRAFLLVDPPVRWSTATAPLDATTGVNSLRAGMVADHAAVYWPRIRAVSGDGTLRVIDPCGSIAGLMARIDANRGVWKAPAGIEASLRGVRGLENRLSDRETGPLNQQAVNALRVFPAGIVSWGARTVAGFDNSSNSDYRYVPVRRVALFIEESLYRGLRFAVFEPNDEPLWAQIRLTAGAFMNNLFRQGAFQGQKASDAYFVKVDSETTTQNDINLGIVNVLVGFAPLKPAEFVLVSIQQKAGQVQV